MPEIGDLIAELGDIGEHQEAVREALGDVELLLVLLSELDTVVLTIGRAALTEVDGDIVYRTLDDADELALWVLLLEVQTTKNALRGHGLIILNEDHVEAGLVHILLIIGFHKIATCVAMNARLDDIKTFNRCLGNFDLSHDISPYIFISMNRFV